MDTAEEVPPDAPAKDARHGTPAASGPHPAVHALSRPRLDPYLLAGILFVAFATLSVCRYRRMATMSWDLGIFEQAIRAYAHLRPPVADLKGPGANILGDHFSPITALLAPFYRLFPSPSRCSSPKRRSSRSPRSRSPGSRRGCWAGAGGSHWASDTGCPGAFSGRSTSTSMRSASRCRCSPSRWRR